MNITLVIEYAGRIRWQQPGPWASLITRSLRDRGHRVRVIADCLAEAELLGADDVVVRSPQRKRLERHPLRFQRWALEQIEHPSISLSSLVPATIWCPLDSSWRDEIVWLTNLRNPATLAMEMLHRLWVPPLAIAQRCARVASGRGTVQLARLGQLEGATAFPLGYASALDPATIEPDIRSRLRHMLGIAPGALVVATSCAHTDRAGLGAFLDGWRAFTHQHPGVLLVVGRKAAMLDRMLRTRGVVDSALNLGQTERPELLLAIADVAAAWHTNRGTTSTGRFISDALAMHTPVLTTHAAGGAELVRRYPGVGLALNDPSPEGWQRSLERARDEAWRSAARNSAQQMAHELDPARLAHAIEKILRA